MPPIDGISSEVEAILDGSTKDIEDALERANPAPVNGMYAMLITKVGGRKVQPKDKSQTPLSCIRLSFRVIGDGTYAGYTFGHDYISFGFADMVSFANAQKGGACKNEEVKAQLGAAVKSASVFHVEVSRSPSQDGKKEYVNVKTSRKLESK